MEAIRTMLGRQTVVMDQRGRISFPAQFRTAIGEVLCISPDLDRIGHLVVRSEEGHNREYEKILADGEKDGADRKDMRWKLRIFTGKSDRVSPDKNGRITVPPGLIEYAGLTPGKKVLVIGVGSYAEIWDEETYLKAEEEYEAE